MREKGKFQVGKKELSFLLFFFFIMWQIILIVHYKGWYHFDELYHISSADPVFASASQYHRAPQINWSITMLAMLLGKSYYVYKLVPLFLSSVVMAVLLYLTAGITEHKLPLFLVTLMMCFQSLLTFNHIFIRFYVWNEAIVALLAFLLYRLSQTKKVVVRLVLHFTYLGVAGFTYFLHSSEESYLAVLLVGIAAWIVNIAAPYIFPWIKNKHLEKWLILSIIMILIMLEVVVFLIKTGDYPLPGFWGRFSTLGVKTPDYFYLPHYFMKQGLLFTIAIIAYGCILLREKSQNGIYGIYTFALLPFIVFNIFFSDIYILRGIVPYIPIMILVVALWFDKWSPTRLRKLIMVCAVVMAIWLSYPEMNVLGFYREPDIQGEFNLHDYESLVSKAREEIQNGRKCIAIWANEYQEACFELDTTYSLDIMDNEKETWNYTQEEILALFDFLMNTDEQYLVLVGPHTDFRIDEILPGFMYGLKAKYPYEEFKHYEFLIYIN